MRLLLSNMKNRAEYLRGIIEDKQRALEAAPPGSMKIGYSRGKPRYYWYYFENGNKTGRYLKEKETELAAALAQKAYDKKALAKARKELAPLEKLIKQYEQGTFENEAFKLSETRKSLITPLNLSDEEFIRQWLDDNYEGLGFEEGEKEYYSDRGLRVRSKSEAGIANKYDAFGIPSKFEKPLKLKGAGIVYPDFTVLNVRKGKVFIHEHLGMMDNPEYAAQNIKKLIKYQKAGYYPGINLILTFETEKQPFDIRRMDDIIKQYLT